MIGVAITKAVGHQRLDLLAEQFLARVSKQFLDLGVDELDRALGVDDHHRVGSRFEQVPELGFSDGARVLGGTSGGDVGHEHEEPTDCVVEDVGHVGHLCMPRSAALVGDHPVKELRLAGEHPLDVWAVQGVELRPEDRAYVPATDLLRRQPEELDERTVGKAVAHARVPVANQGR